MFHSQCVRTTTFVSCELWYNHTLEAYMSKITSIDLIQWLAWKYSQMKKTPNHPQSSTKLAEFLFIFTWCYLFCFVSEIEVEREIMRFNGNVSIHMFFYRGSIPIRINSAFEDMETIELKTIN